MKDIKKQEEEINEKEKNSKPNIIKEIKNKHIGSDFNEFLEEELQNEIEEINEAIENKIIINIPTTEKELAKIKNNSSFIENNEIDIKELTNIVSKQNENLNILNSKINELTTKNSKLTIKTTNQTSEINHLKTNYKKELELNKNVKDKLREVNINNIDNLVIEYNNEKIKNKELKITTLQQKEEIIKKQELSTSLEKKLNEKNNKIKTIEDNYKKLEDNIDIKEKELKQTSIEVDKLKLVDKKFKELITQDILKNLIYELNKMDTLKLYKIKEFFENYFFNEKKMNHEYIENAEIDIKKITQNSNLIQIDLEANDLSYNSLMYKFNEMKKIIKNKLEKKIEYCNLDKNSCFEQYSLSLEILQKNSSDVDPDNLVMAFKIFNKIILDTLVEHNFLSNDNIKCVKGISISSKIANISKNKLSIKINKKEE